MADVTCSAGDFYDSVMAMFESVYEHDVAQLASDVYEAADDTVEHLKADIGRWSQTEDLPSGRAKLTYEKGWTNYKYDEHEGHIEAVVANKTAPGLTHLVEKGHELFLFGRDTGRRTKARPHIKDAYEYAVARHFSGGDAT